MFRLCCRKWLNYIFNKKDFPLGSLKVGHIYSSRTQKSINKKLTEIYIRSGKYETQNISSYSRNSDDFIGGTDMKVLKQVFSILMVLIIAFSATACGSESTTQKSMGFL